MIAHKVVQKNDNFHQNQTNSSKKSAPSATFFLVLTLSFCYTDCNLVSESEGYENMRIIAADDERLPLQMLTDTIKSVLPQAELFSFSKVSEVLACAKEKPCDIAFLDIRMRSVTGLELAQRLKNICPRVNIIFVTAYREYACEAMALHASGYIEKPVTAEKIRRELSNLRYPVAQPKPQALLEVTCFGNFDVRSVKQKNIPLHFTRAKSKECFAYLISRQGHPCTVRELAGILFEDMPYDRKQANYVQQIITAMMKSLREVDAECVVHKSYNALSVNPDLIDCDYYRFCSGETAAINSYRGEFMLQYPWAEFMIGNLK